MGARRELRVPYLLFFGIQLEALVQRAAVLLQVLLLLIPHALRVFHHLLLDAAKQTGGQTRRGAVSVFFLHTKDNWVGDDRSRPLARSAAGAGETAKALTILSSCSPTRSQAWCVEAHLSRTV